MVQSGNIPVIELQKINDNDGQMKRLCAALTVQGDKKENGQLSFKTVESALHQRMQEFHAFDQHRSYLSHLCNHISGPVEGNEFYEDIVIRSQLMLLVSSVNKQAFPS